MGLGSKSMKKVDIALLTRFLSICVVFYPLITSNLCLSIQVLELIAGCCLFPFAYWSLAITLKAKCTQASKKFRRKFIAIQIIIIALYLMSLSVMSVHLIVADRQAGGWLFDHDLTGFCLDLFVMVATAAAYSFSFFLLCKHQKKSDITSLKLFLALMIPLVCGLPAILFSTSTSTQLWTWFVGQSMASLALGRIYTSESSKFDAFG